MSSQPTGEQPNSAFDLFDRWMSNREPMGATPDPGAAPGEVVISDTKASREAARRLLEAAQRGEEPPHLTVAEPEPAAYAEPEPAPAAYTAPEPVAYAQPVTDTEPVAHPEPVAISTPEPVAYAEPEPAAAPAPVAGKRRAAVPTDYVPQIPAIDPAAFAEAELATAAAPSAGKRRAAVPTDYVPQIPAIDPAALAAVEPDPGVVAREAMPTPPPAYPVAAPPVLAPEPVTMPHEPADVQPPVAEAPSPAPVLPPHPVEAPATALSAPVSEPVVTPPPAVEAPAVEAVAVEAVEAVVEAPATQSHAAQAPAAPAPHPHRFQMPAEEDPVVAARAAGHTFQLPEITEPEPEPDNPYASMYADPVAVAVAEPEPVEVAEPEPAKKRGRRGRKARAEQAAPDAGAMVRERARKQRSNKILSRIRQALTAVMLTALAGAGVMGYFLYRGDEWALRPTASLAALTVFLMAAMITAPNEV
ncbi:hypothetical protein [Nocardioides sp.]|uniref:hypothetical protein n=1 Tax=Nocardioides sp. TaxID=35761 RepID=UPI003527B6A1